MNHKATEKTKKKPTAKRSSGCMPILKWIGVFFGVIAVLIFAYFATLYLWLNQGMVLSSLPSELEPTAQALLKNPYVDPPLDDSEFFIGVTEVDRNAREICFIIAAGRGDGYDSFYQNGDIQINANYVEIWINDNLAGRTYTGFLSIYRDMNRYTSSCVDGILEEGLHLIELRLMDNAFDTPNYIQRWAIEVDCRYESCVENAAPSWQDFNEARSRSPIVDSLPEELSTYTQTLLDNPNIYDDVMFSMTDISVPTVFPSAFKICLDFRGIDGGLSINGTTYDQYGDVLSNDGEIDNQSVGTLTLNNESHTVYSIQFDDGVLCHNYRLQSGLVLIQLELDSLEQIYEWAIEIE